MKKIAAAAWADFANEERDFLNWLTDNDVTVSLYNNNDSSKRYSVYEIFGQEIYKAPRYIRAISFLHAKNFDEFEYRYKSAKKLYDKAVTLLERDNKKLPRRFPILKKDHIEEIRLSKKTAYKSYLLKNNKNVYICNVSVPPYNDSEIVRIHDEINSKRIETLSSMGLKVVLEPEESKTPHWITVTFQSFMKHYNVKNVRARQQTGNQHIARIRYKNDSKSVTERFGYIITTNYDCLILDAQKQGERPHTLDKKYHKIDLGFDFSECNFYDLDNKIG